MKCLDQAPSYVLLLSQAGKKCLMWYNNSAFFQVGQGSKNGLFMQLYKKFLFQLPSYANVALEE